MIINEIESFMPILPKQPRIMILGSVPSVQSLKENFYYAHPRNSFWPIMTRILKELKPKDDEMKKAMMLRHNILLWDVLAVCEREGSLDKDIKEPVPNDIIGILNKHPSIEGILLNGGKAYSLFCRYFKDEMNKRKIEYLKMPSTSPAYASMKVETKFRIWKETIDGFKIK